MSVYKIPTLKSPLGIALVVQMRVLAALAHRWWLENDSAESACAGAWTRHDVLVIMAKGHRADRIAGELERVGLFEPQHDTKGKASA